MRCIDCQHRWRHSLWHLRESFYARCPRCYRLQLSTWDETYYHIPLIWRVLTGLGAKKVRCKACRFNFVSFRLIKNKAEWAASMTPATTKYTDGAGVPIPVLNPNLNDTVDHP
ncbi:hypothetical protein [Bryobacter aggregatus]|uniref:hypothetical protein n=1 Tax=Bryobacter aggregatus TaxID=360054 RepID=UPI0012BAE97F|nr:hypothetical protein [Bryobacter aggregatus]